MMIIVGETEMQLIMVYASRLERWQVGLKLIARFLRFRELSPFGGLSAQVLQRAWLGLVEVGQLAMMVLVDHDHEIHAGPLTSSNCDTKAIV
jgi:hypothetical protein